MTLNLQILTTMKQTVMEMLRVESIECKLNIPFESFRHDVNDDFISFLGALTDKCPMVELKSSDTPPTGRTATTLMFPMSELRSFCSNPFEDCQEKM